MKLIRMFQKNTMLLCMKMLNLKLIGNNVQLELFDMDTFQNEFNT
ncbi:hypothetical protein [Enterococcus faecalis]|nr:hypothetical protein [Enterococcus faecalis]